MHRFRTEVARIYEVMDTQLGNTEYLAGDYSIADMACWPWVYRYDWQGQDLKDFPNVKRWFEACGARPGLKRGSEVGAELMQQPMTDADKKLLFNLRDEDFKKPAG
jgi:GST-like protein